VGRGIGPNHAKIRVQPDHFFGVLEDYTNWISTKGGSMPCGKFQEKKAPSLVGRGGKWIIPRSLKVNIAQEGNLYFVRRGERGIQWSIQKLKRGRMGRTL